TSATSYQYGYDALNRLVQVNNGSATESYTYDALGNRLTKTDAAGTLAYVYDAANQLKEIHQNAVAGPLLTSLTYDDNGNLITKTDAGGTSLFTYDALNRLVQANKPAQSTETYAYDDQGRRIQQTVGGTVANYLYNGQAIAAEYTGTWNSARALYTHGAGTDTPLIRATATTAQYFHQDGLGSVVGATNQVGELTGTASYDAWGNSLAALGTIPLYGYTGREPDATGLVYYRNRYYDPTIGRFIQRDPIGMDGGMNLYAYVNANPVNFTDPMGTLPRDVSTLNVDTVTTSPYNTSTPGLDAANQSLASMTQTGPVSYDTGVGTGLDRASLVAGPGAPSSTLSELTQYLAPVGPNPTVSGEGLQFIAGFEGFQPKVYQDPTGFSTIGFGHRLLQGETFPNALTREQAFDLLRSDIQTRVQPGLNLISVALTQNQVNALGSFIFNVG